MKLIDKDKYTDRYRNCITIMVVGKSGIKGKKNIKTIKDIKRYTR